MGTPGTITIAAGDRGTSWTAQVPVATDDGSIVSYSATFTPSDGTTDVSGFSINNSGLISATLASDFFAAGGTITAAVTATDNAGNTSSENYTITVDVLQTSIYTTEIANSVMFDGSSWLVSPAFSNAVSTFTVSFWLKRSRTLSTLEGIFAVTGGGAGDATGGSRSSYLFSGDRIRIYDNYAGNANNYGNIYYRDLSAFYHIVISCNSGTLSFYNNGALDFTDNRVSTTFDTANKAVIGGYTGGVDLFQGYMADVYFVEGQALTPSSFGQYSTQGTDVYWIPKEYGTTGTSLDNYGNNGFHLKFDDPSYVYNSTTYGLGKDSSGRNNHWTPSA